MCFERSRLRSFLPNFFSPLAGEETVSVTRGWGREGGGHSAKSREKRRSYFNPSPSRSQLLHFLPSLPVSIHNLNNVRDLKLKQKNAALPQPFYHTTTYITDGECVYTYISRISAKEGEVQKKGREYEPASNVTLPQFLVFGSYK